MPEFVLIGRSNVGKSSLLNALTGRRALARVSATPGKTRLLNVYRAPGFYLIDLPGYGFAKISKGERLAFRKMVERLLRNRNSLTGVAWLLDVRHTPSREDAEFHELLVGTGRPVLAVLTKSDKLTRSRLEETVIERARELGLPRDQVQAISSTTGEGVAQLADALIAAAEGVQEE